MSDVSVVVCVRNCAALLPACLSSIRENAPLELIIVDGLSSDGTVEAARAFTSAILSDDGKGLAYARNLGAQSASGRFIAFVGPDNILPPRTLERMVQEKEARSWAGVSAMTRLHEPDGYLSHAMDRYKSYRFAPGERSVIGTPTLFDADHLRAHPFDDDLTSSDDADLCARMSAAGLRFGVADAIVFEQGTTAAGSILERWRWYGQSDAEFFSKYAKDWGLPRKAQSLLHPLLAELVRPARVALANRDLAILPFLVGITATRYAGWVLHALRRSS